LRSRVSLNYARVKRLKGSENLHGTVAVEISNRGFLIGIEGIDAAGKRTQAILLNSWLMSKGLSTQIIAFPDYTTRIGAEIKAFLSGERNYPPAVRHMLFAANRWERAHEIDEALSAGKAIIVDRYSESNLAYGGANGLSEEWLYNLEVGLPKTDLVIVLDAPPETMTFRRGRKKDKYERDFQLQNRAREIYRELSRKYSWVLIDATGTVESVHNAVTRAITQRLLMGGILS
jgi:dTMP kinase